MRIPKFWSRDSIPDAATTLYHLADGGSAFLFSLRDRDSNPNDVKPQKEKYWISLDHRGQIRVATDEEWRATPLIPQLVGSYSRLDWSGSEPTGIVRFDRRTVSFNGVPFFKTGDIWGGAHLAPGDRYLIVKSFNGYWADGKAPSQEAYFVDVFDVATGNPLAAIRGQYRNGSPMHILGNVSWISERDLVFYYGWEGRNLIVCRFN